MTGFSVSPTDRAAAIARVAEIEESLGARIAKADAARAVKAVMAFYPSFPRDDPKTAMEAYVRVVERFPLSVVVRVVEAIQSGRLGRPDRAPSVPELHKALETVVAPLVRERDELRELLVAADHAGKPIKRSKSVADAFDRLRWGVVLDDLVVELAEGVGGNVPL
jgi:hypothetical protein